MIDLNSLVPPSSPLYLTGADGINDRGEIAGSAFLKAPQRGSRLSWRFLRQRRKSPAIRLRRSSCPKTSARRFSDDCAFGISEIA